MRIIPLLTDYTTTAAQAAALLVIAFREHWPNAG